MVSGMTSGGRSGKGSCSYRWATARAEAPGTRGDARSSATGEEAEEEAEEGLRAAAKEAMKEAKAKKPKRQVTKGGGMKMKQGSTGRTG